jgi:D-tyrosyl-tRNA(Tyr) deacylase
VNEKTEGEIGEGVCVLLGVTHDDGPDQVRWLAAKTANLRIFEDEEGKLNRSLLETKGAALVVSQFTLYGDCRKGRRPSFVGAARPELARRLYEDFCRELAALGIPVATGVFQAHMQVELCNDGPVTLVVDTPEG